MNPSSDYVAKHRFARISVRKLRPILDLVRGKYADDAMDILKYLPHRGARMIEQVLKSAMANAEDLKEHKPEYNGLKTDRLWVKEAVAGHATSLKRMIPKARGSAGPIIKRNCHVKIVLSDE